jgi:hypothetical protein
MPQTNLLFHRYLPPSPSFPLSFSSSLIIFFLFRTKITIHSLETNSLLFARRYIDQTRRGMFYRTSPYINMCCTRSPSYFSLFPCYTLLICIALPLKYTLPLLFSHSLTFFLFLLQNYKYLITVTLPSFPLPFPHISFY